IPCNHRAGNGLDLSHAGTKIVQLTEADVLRELQPLLEDSGVLKIAQNLKYDYLMFLQRGIRVAPFDDTLLLSLVLGSPLPGHGSEELSEPLLSLKPQSFNELAGKGKGNLTFDCVPVKEATRYAAEDADVTLRLYALLKPRLIAESKVGVYET